MKRLFDFLVASAALIVLLPLIAVLAVLVALKLGNPVLFVQERPGLGGRIFRLVKFRTMREAKDKNGNLLPDCERLTPFGNFLRSTSLDELPSLINIVRGDLSLVGPRPLLVDYLPLYSRRHARRHEVRPGLTGWSQVNGRNALGWEEKLDLDVWYVENRTFLLDVKILVLTVGKVFKRDGISAAGDATMPRFTGSKNGK